MTTPIVLALPPVVELNPTGVQGPRGNATLTGTGTPTTTVGIDGDYYIDTAAYPAGVTLYGPKAAGAWPASGVTVSSTAGALLAANNLSDVADAATARTNLGLGGAATRNVGTTTGTVTAGDDARLSDPRTPTQHAASHGAGGTDPVPVSQSQVIGLAAALAALAALTGATFTGPVTVSSDGTAINAVSRGTTGNFAAYVLETANVERWSWQMLNDSTNDLWLTDSANGVQIIHVVPNPTTPTTSLFGVVATGSKNGLSGIRLAGFKNSAGAPTSGAWAAGDVVLDSAGAWHLCTASGAPGTWT